MFATAKKTPKTFGRRDIAESRESKLRAELLAARQSGDSAAVFAAKRALDSLYR